MARENRDWGYRRIQGACPIWGTSWRAARSLTFWNVKESSHAGAESEDELEGVSEPALGNDCRRGFLHRGSVDAPRLQRFMVLFLIELSTRKVEIAGIAATPNGLWMSQIGRNDDRFQSWTESLPEPGAADGADRCRSALAR
jgi:hypothetical protein